MNYENLQFAQEGNIVTVTVSRPKALNALNHQTMNEIGHFFSEGYKQYANLAGVVLTGEGEKAFVAGADIKEFLALDEGRGGEMSKRGQDIFFHIENMPVPVIAAVNGFALGGGCELAMACHMRIAGANAKFGQPEVNLGIIAGYGGTQRLVQYIGKGKAMELLLTGDMIGADEAHQLGLANHVVEAGQEVAKAKEIIAKIATKGPLAVKKTIEAVNANFSKDGYEFEWKAFGEAAGTSDFKEGAQAFVERRAPNFKNS